MSNLGVRAAMAEAPLLAEIGDRQANSGPRAMSRALRLFDLLARHGSGMTLSELSVALGVPKSTFLASLKALSADGFLICEGNQYRLGPAIYRLAGTILSSWSMPEMIRFYVRGLAQATGESVVFAIADWEIGQAIYIDAVNSPQPVHYAMRAGIRAPLYVSAAGRVLLAYAPAERRSEYLARAHFKSITPATRATHEAIEENLQTIRELGYCASFGEMLKDTAAIAVPVFDANDDAIGALLVAAPLDRMQRNFDKLRAEAVSFGRQASGLAAA